VIGPRIDVIGERRRRRRTLEIVRMVRMPANYMYIYINNVSRVINSDEIIQPTIRFGVLPDTTISFVSGPKSRGDILPPPRRPFQTEFRWRESLIAGRVYRRTCCCCHGLVRLLATITVTRTRPTVRVRRMFCAPKNDLHPQAVFVIK